MTRLAAAALLHARAGAPAMPGCAPLPAPLPCWLCGATAQVGADRVRWEGASFTDQNKARAQSSPIVCEPCVWACSWSLPPGHPPAAEGKRGVNLRLFSHLYDAGDYRYANKGDKPAILAWLRAPHTGPWFAAISDTGQKHTLPWTPLNLGGRGGLVRFEERTVRLGDWALCDAMIALLTVGVTKGEIETGRYRVLSYQHSASAVRTFEAQHGRQRGAAWFALCLWCAQRDEDGYAATIAARKEDHGRDSQRAGGMGTGRSRRVPGGRRVEPDALGADRDADARGGQDDGDGRGVGDAHAARPAPDGRDRQGALFGDRGTGGPGR